MPTNTKSDLAQQTQAMGDSLQKAHIDIALLGERIDNLSQDCVALYTEQKALNIQVAEILEVMRHGRNLTANEQEWVRRALQREARRERLYHAIVEKSLASLVVAVVIWAGSVLWRAFLEQGK